MGTQFKGTKNNPKILMLGWEYPPLFAGGMGIVTENLVNGLLSQGVDLTLALPQFITENILENFPEIPVPLLTQNNLKIPDLKYVRIKTPIYSPYMGCEEYKKIISPRRKATPLLNQEGRKKEVSVYGKNLWEEIDRFAEEVLFLTKNQKFDLVHAQDWITAECAIQLKLQKNIPFVMHIHATEVDRTGNKNPSGEVFEREKYAMNLADKVITVSEYTKRILVETYGIDGEKIEVVYNAFEEKKYVDEEKNKKIWNKDKSQFWVLFIGRVTLQKGPEYFVEAAFKTLQSGNKNIHFFIAGTGDMLPEIQQKIINLGISENVHCLGFLTPEERDALYMFTDACIIPSVSEPFGLTAIEVIDYCTPLIISKNCGACEIIHHKLEVDFWDTEKMAEYVLALEKYPELRRTLRNKALEHQDRLTWEIQSARVLEIYKEILV